jgi:hypothetical protein
LLIDRLLPPEKYPRHRRNAFIVLAGLMVLAWANVGGLRGGGGLIHEWEQFHFYLGAKYQKEVGWFDLYKAALVADRESANALVNLRTIREIRTFELISVDKAMEEAPRVRAKFSDARWAEFKDDWVKMLARPGNWAGTLQDHGNSNSPAWAVIAHPIASLTPLTKGGQTFIGLLDMLLMAAMWWFAYKTFGVRLASIGLFFFAVPPIVFDYLAGSFLRWDWLFALGLAACFMKRERWATAGALFGYALATKLFPLFFGLALAARAALLWRREGVFAVRYRRFLAGTVASGAFFVLAAAAMFGSFGVWAEYKDRIQVAQVEKFYAIQYSLKTVYLQAATTPASELLAEGLWPKRVKQNLPEVDIKDHATGFLLLRLLFTALVLVLILRAGDIEAFTLGPLLVFVWLTVNMYYWNMLGLTALGLAMRAERTGFSMLLGLHAIFAFFYLYQHTNHGYSEGFAIACLLGLGILAAAGYELFALKGRWAEFFGPAAVSRQKA